MNTKKDTQLITALALVLAVALAPVFTAAFAQTDDANAVDEFEEVDVAEPVDNNTDETGTENADDKDDNETDRKQVRDEMREKMQELREQTKEKIRELKEQRAEKVRDFKEKMSDQYKDRLRDSASLDVRPDFVDPDREPDLYFDGGASGWAMIGGYAYDASTKLVGEAYHIRGGMWKVHVTEGTISIGDRTGIPVELTGTAHGHRLMLHGTAELSDDVEVRIALKGHYAATHTEGVFALSLKTLGYHTENNSGRIPLAQVGDVSVWANENAPDAVVPEPAPVEIPEIFS